MRCSRRSALSWHAGRARCRRCSWVSTSPASAERLSPFLDRLGETFLPRKIVAVVTNGAPDAALAGLVPVAAEKTPIEGRPAAYVCERRVCKRPTDDPAVFAEQLAAP
jgi:uncharacterized protein